MQATPQRPRVARDSASAAARTSALRLPAPRLVHPPGKPKNAGMRLWSLHPGHLDSRRLVALWREGLLAQAVLKGETRGYRHHPQLVRFRAQPSPVASIGEYLKAVHEEAVRREYRFDAGKIAYGGAVPGIPRIDVPRSQIEFEWRHLMAKLEIRAPEWHERQLAAPTPRVHPLFRQTPGGIADWERP